MLTALGYHVIPASSPGRALEMAEDGNERIDLLFTDVIMPEMNGASLAGILRQQRPDMAVLYMSGYTADTIAKHGVLSQENYFLQKPFDLKTLSLKIREVLDADTPRQYLKKKRTAE